MTIGFFLAYLKYQNDRTSSPSVASKQVRAVQNTVSGGQGLVAAVRPLLEAMEKQEQEMSQTGASQSLIQAESKRSMTMLQNVLRPFFSKYDVDGSGTLETSELGRVFMDLNEPKVIMSSRPCSKTLIRTSRARSPLSNFVMGFVLTSARRRPTSPLR